MVVVVGGSEPRTRPGTHRDFLRMQSARNPIYRIPAGAVNPTSISEGASCRTGDSPSGRLLGYPRNFSSTAARDVALDSLSLPDTAATMRRISKAHVSHVTVSPGPHPVPESGAPDGVLGTTTYQNQRSPPTTTSRKQRGDYLDPLGNTSATITSMWGLLNLGEVSDGSVYPIGHRIPSNRGQIRCGGK